MEELLIQASKKARSRLKGGLRRGQEFQVFFAGGQICRAPVPAIRMSPLQTSTHFVCFTNSLHQTTIVFPNAAHLLLLDHHSV
jgi:hypothetical protein